ncbi:MAG: hypothetical protein ABII64_09085 [Elusimicrobiota bacterium]
MKINKIDLSKIKTVSLINRPSKVKKTDFGSLLKKPVKFRAFINSIPSILAGNNLKNLIKDILRAKYRGKPVIFAFGAHVIKCGLSPLVIDLCDRGLITALATNGASTVHDFELSLSGKTSEDVSERLKNGSFGMTKETGEFLNNAAKHAAREDKGLGEVIGKEIAKGRFKFKNLSIFSNAFVSQVPVTVHSAIGTDIVYQHPQCDGAAWGKASYNDFLKFAGLVSNLGSGGVLLNFGSAVILPEVFLKALTICRNLGYKTHGFTTANFDMIHQYRPMQNIVTRPTQTGGRGYYFIGHHEIMLPLLYAALIDGE